LFVFERYTPFSGSEQIHDKLPAKSKACENDLYVNNEEHKDFINPNPEVVIAGIFNTLPVALKMLDDKKAFLCKVKEIVYKYQC
jgi:hypothetical protein